MRELKFRAWDDLNKKWFMDSPMGFDIIGECVLFGEWGHFFDEFLFGKNSKTPKDLIIEQYTGVKDNNGTEIYEGDIISWCTTREKGCYEGHDPKEKKELITIEWISPVEWEDGGFMVTESFDLDQKNNCWLCGAWQPIEIIGNIHDNPEIL